MPDQKQSKPKQQPKQKSQKSKTVKERIRDLSTTVGIPMTKLQQQLLEFALDEIEESSMVTVDLKTGRLVLGKEERIKPATIHVVPPGKGAVRPEDHPSFGMSSRTRGGSNPDEYTEIDMSGLDNRE